MVDGDKRIMRSKTSGLKEGVKHKGREREAAIEKQNTSVGRSSEGVHLLVLRLEVLFRREEPFHRSIQHRERQPQGKRWISVSSRKESGGAGSSAVASSSFFSSLPLEIVEKWKDRKDSRIQQPCRTRIGRKCTPSKQNLE